MKNEKEKLTDINGSNDYIMVRAIKGLKDEIAEINKKIEGLTIAAHIHGDDENDPDSFTINAPVSEMPKESPKYKEGDLLLINNDFVVEVCAVHPLQGIYDVRDIAGNRNLWETDMHFQLVEKIGNSTITVKVQQPISKDNIKEPSLNNKQRIKEPSLNNKRRADYIMNHYSRDRKDILCLARAFDKYEEGYISALNNIRQGLIEANVPNTNIVDYIDATLEQYQKGNK